MQKYRVLLFIYSVGFIWSAIHPHDYYTWILEVFPAIIGLVVIVSTFKSFPLTYLTYCLILFHCMVLFVGGHYTYAEVPLFDWIKDTLHQNRNNYDKLGHFTQGFVPAIIIREIYIRKDIVKKGGWLSFLTICTCLSISACYEFLEWFVAVSSGQSSESFLGTQGYIWDTQSDMLYATIGAICAIISLSKIQNKNIEALIAQKT